MKILKIIAVVFVIVLAFFAVRNKMLMDRYAKDYGLQKAENEKILHTHKEVEDAVIKGRTASMRHLGKNLKLINMKQIFPTKSDDLPSAKHPKLLLVFSELGCNVCRDDETRFAAGIASQYGKDYVMAVVHASNQRYVQNYIRMNQVNFPVYFCPDQSFLNENGIKNTPMIFVVDENNRVVASHFPIPGHLEYSEPMHRFCYYYFNRLERKP
ncbi:MAG: hypothetical protein GY940_02245 [bacterium]|nr:hypothetical protein [bacterium]